MIRTNVSLPTRIRAVNAMTRAGVLLSITDHRFHKCAIVGTALCRRVSREATTQDRLDLPSRGYGEAGQPGRGGYNFRNGR